MTPENRDSHGNLLRLSLKQLLLVAGIVTALCVALPVVWKAFEPFEPGQDFRLPYSLSHDYWLYERYSERARADHDVLVIGDSVVWGEYVVPGETLSSHLNRAGAERYANLGLSGSHPLALEGLIRYYARPLSGDKVLLHFNPLWMSSPRHDLQLDDGRPFNHPELVPQFSPRVPSYRAGLSERLGISIGRHTAVLNWVNHLRVGYYESQDLYRWTLDHPFESPLAPLGVELPAPLSKPRHRARSWLAQGAKQDLPWIDPASSLQWQAFERSVDLLRSRECEGFVLIGPFNEHMLEDSSLERYIRLRGECSRRLLEKEISFIAPVPLPTETYADASHPLSAGYALLAEMLLAHGPFLEWLRG